MVTIFFVEFRNQESFVPSPFQAVAPKKKVHNKDSSRSGALEVRPHINRETKFLGEGRLWCFVDFQSDPLRDYHKV